MSDDPFDDLKAMEDSETPPEPQSNVADLASFRDQARQKARRGASPSKRASRFFSPVILDGKPVPPREWLVDDLIPARTVTLLCGDGGTGKSLVALQLVVAVALGKPWLGRPVSGGRAVFASAEDDEAELHRRLHDVTRAEGVGFADLDRLSVRSLAGEDALLAMPDPRTGILHPSDLYQELDAFLTDAEPTVLVLDTLADLFPGNENDRAQARQFIGMMRGLAIRHDCSVVLLAHPSLSGLQSRSGTSGSTGWSNSVRARLYLQRVTRDDHEANPDARTLSTMKANYSRTGEEIALSWKEGVFVPDAPEPALDRCARNAKAERVFLKLLKLHAQQGRRVNHMGGKTYAPAAFAEHPQSEGVTNRAFKDAMEALLGSGRIVIGQEGPPSRRVSFIQEAQL